MSSDYKNIKLPTEKNVAQYLDEKGIEYKHEVPVCVKDEQGRLRIWYPDFYPPKLGLYLEVCGSERIKDEYYRRECVYKENKISVVFLHYWKPVSDWKKFLDSEIDSIERGRLYESKKLKM